MTSLGFTPTSVSFFVARLASILSGAISLIMLGACGTTHTLSSNKRATRTSSTEATQKITGDYDTDDNKPNDNDTLGPRYFGYEAKQPLRSEIAAAVMRYYAAAAAGNGARACTMLNSSLARAVPLSYGRFGPRYLHSGETCAEVLTLLFEHDHKQLTTEATHLSVTRVRVEDDSAFVLLRIGTRASERQIEVVRENSKWRMQTVLDSSVSSVCC